MSIKTLTAELATIKEIPKTEAEAQIRDVFEVLGEALVNGTEIFIPGFGRFSVKDTEERAGRNPKTGESLQIPASRRVAFKVASTLRTAVKETV